MKKSLFITLLLVLVSTSAFADIFSNQVILKRTSCTAIIQNGLGCYDTDDHTLCFGNGSSCVAVGGGSVSDADYGDITVSGGVWAVDANSVALTTDTTGNYAAGDAEAGNALAGDSATAFFGAGTIEHERGGLEADVNAYDGLIGITGGATYNVTGTTTQIIIFDGVGAPTVAALSGQATMTNGGVVTVSDLTCTNCLSTTEVASADLATNVSDADFGDVTVAIGAWAVEDNSHTHDATTLSTDSVSADELNATGVEAELEAVLDLDALQGAVADGQVPNNITIDLATTATTANAGDSATAFFSSGTVEGARLGTFSKAFVITGVTSAGDFGAIWKSPAAITITSVNVVQVGATNVVGHLDECDGNGANCAGVDGATDITADGLNDADDGSLSNASIDANDWIGWHTTSVSGTNTRISITFNYTVN